MLLVTFFIILLSVGGFSEHGINTSCKIDYEFHSIGSPKLELYGRSDDFSPQLTNGDEAKASYEISVFGNMSNTLDGIRAAYNLRCGDVSYSDGNDISGNIYVSDIIGRDISYITFERRFTVPENSSNCIFQIVRVFGTNYTWAKETGCENADCFCPLNGITYTDLDIGLYIKENVFTRDQAFASKSNENQIMDYIFSGISTLIGAIVGGIAVFLSSRFLQNRSWDRERIRRIVDRYLLHLYNYLKIMIGRVSEFDKIGLATNAFDIHDFSKIIIKKYSNDIYPEYMGFFENIDMLIDRYEELRFKISDSFESNVSKSMIEKHFINSIDHEDFTKLFKHIMKTDDNFDSFELRCKFVTDNGDIFEHIELKSTDLEEFKKFINDFDDIGEFYHVRDEIIKISNKLKDVLDKFISDNY